MGYTGRAMQPALSIVIPTHKRADILRRTLDHIAAQTVADKIEVIVVSDGPDNATEKVISDQRAEVWFPLHLKTIPKSHQGVARNRGVDAATGEFCLFIDDDIFLAPDACEIHLARHHESRMQNAESRNSGFGIRDSNFAVLGFTTWDPAIGITELMAWLEKSGWQFGYPMLAAYAGRAVPISMQHRFTYTSHISLPISIAKAHPFREDVSLYGWEDIEWGMRLRDAGVPLVYQPQAKALHHRRLTLAQSLQRMETIGESAVRLAQLVPALDRLPRGLKRVAYEALALLPTLRGRHAAAFLRGIRAGERSLVA